MAINRNKDSRPWDTFVKPKKQEDSTNPTLMSFYGKLKGIFGDGVQYQRKIRDE